MTLERGVLWVNCGLFVVFGLGFVLAPVTLSTWVTGSAPGTASAVTDMRATYGGMALGLGVVFGLCAARPDRVALGMRGVVVVMIALAGARLLGMIVDGPPNVFMYAFLAAEAAMAGLAMYAVARASDDRCSRDREPA